MVSAAEWAASDSIAEEPGDHAADELGERDRRVRRERDEHRPPALAPVSAVGHVRAVPRRAGRRIAVF